MTVVVQSVPKQPINGVASWTFTLSATGAGNLLVVKAGVQQFGGTNPSSVTVTDNGSGNSWATAVFKIGTGGDRFAFVCYCLSVSAGTTSVTVTPNTGTFYGSSGIEEVSGGPWALDQTGSAVSTSSGTNTATCSAVDVGTTDFVAAAMQTDGGQSNMGISDPPTGYTSSSVEQDDSSFAGSETCYRINSSALTDTVTWTYNASASAAGLPCAIASFKVSGGGGVSGSAAITEGADAVSGTGKTTIVGTAAITEGSDTVAGVGKTTIVGSASITEGADTVAGSGVTTITGTAAITEGADTVTASGATNPAGAAAITEGADVVTASGVTTIIATAAIVEGADTVIASGTTTILGTAAILEGLDAVTASGTSGSTVVGTAAITEGADIVSAAGTTTVVASAAIVEGPDTVTASGVTTIVGIAAILEGGDIVVASGVAGIVIGTAAITEGPDGVSASGQSGSTQAAGKHRKRYGVVDGWRLLLFNTKVDADTFKAAVKQTKSPAKALKRIRTVEPVQVINVPELKRSLPPPQAARVDQMIREHRFEQVAQLPNIAAQYDAKREEAEVTEVSHVIEAHRQTSIEHAQAIHQALKVLHDIRKLRRLQ